MIRILILDDDPMVVAGCCRILEAQGMEGIPASTADTALEMLEKDSFDLMICDITMPGRSGFDMIRAVRAIHPLMPILLMTGLLTQETIEKGKTYGASHYVAKPFTPDELVRAVMDTLGHDLS